MPGYYAGSSGNDTVSGTANNDTFNRSTGSDTMSGDLGSDTYLFCMGSGKDIIVESARTGDVNTVLIGATLILLDVTVRRVNND